MACSIVYVVVIFTIAFKLSETVFVDNSREENREELLKTLKERWASKSIEEIIREGSKGLPETRSHNSYEPKKDDADCSIRYLAFNYSKKLLSPSADFKAISDGLQLYTLCGITVSVPEKKPYFEHENRVQQIKQSGKYIELFVDPSHHAKLKIHEGTISSPFRNIETALRICNYRRKDDGTHCIIRLREGVHFLDQTLVLTAKHNNVLLTKYKDENAIVSGGKVINTSWQLHDARIDSYEGQNAVFDGIEPHQSRGPVAFMGIFNESKLCQFLCEQQTTCTSYAHFGKSAGDFANMCYARKDGLWNPIAHAGVTSGKKIRIFVSNVGDQGVKPFTQMFVSGKREVRARFPNGDPEKTGLHTTQATGYVSSAVQWLPPKKSEPAKEIHIDNPHRDRTPFSTFYLGIGGPVSQFQPPVSYWGVKSPAGGGGSTYGVPTGLKFSSDLEFAKRNWSNPTTGIVHAFQHYHWENWQFKLDNRSDTDSMFKWSYGGFQGARGSGDGKEWYVENIFEELDVPGEWFLDESTMKLYYYPSGGLPSQVIVPVIASVVTVAGTMEMPVKGASIMGLSFAHTESTFMKGYQVPSGGDWTVHRNAMVYAQGTEGLVISGCTFTAPGGNGIFIGNYTRNATIADNYIAFAGDNGIAVVGHSLLINGTNGDQPRGMKILRNLIHDTGIWGKGTYSYSQSISCQSHIEGNVFFNGPRGSININDGFGGANLITKNVLFNFVRETQDHGPINTWDRVPYLTKILDVTTASLLPKENFVTKCLVIGNYNSEWPIDHDDGSSYWADLDNVLAYGGWKNYLGHSKKAMRNIYAYPDKYRSDGYCMDTRAQSLGASASGYGEVWMDNKCILNRDSVYRIGSCNENQLEDVCPQTGNNQFYTQSGKVTVQCGGSSWSLEQFQDRGFDVGTTENKLVGPADVISWAKNALGI